MKFSILFAGLAVALSPLAPLTAQTLVPRDTPAAHDTAQQTSGTVLPPPPRTASDPSGPVFAAVGPYEAAIDRLPHAKPPVPVLGPAGSTITDPVFLSRITRVTDESTRPDNLDRSYKTPSSPHQNAWSATGSRFYVVGGGGAILPYSLDARTGATRRIQPSATGAGGLVLNFYIEPQFSYVRDAIVYGSVVGGSLRTIDQYNFDTGGYSRLLDLDALVPGLAGTYVGGIASSAGATERVIAMFGGTRQDLHHYAVIFDATNPQNRTILDTKASTVNGNPTGTVLNFLLHHAMIDRSGRYVMLYPTSADQTGARKAPQSVSWDTLTNVFTEMPVSSRPYGHDAFGYGVSVNQDCCAASAYDAAQWQFRALASPLASRDVITTVLAPKEVYLADHTTWNNARADNSAPFVSGLYRYGTGNTTPWRAWDDEIVAVQSDAAPGVNPTVWRFAHHRSNVASDSNASATSFWYMPRPNVSPNGNWVLFTSNWEKTLGTDPSGEPGTGARQDVFLVALKSTTPAAGITQTSVAEGSATGPVDPLNDASAAQTIAVASPPIAALVPHATNAANVTKVTTVASAIVITPGVKVTSPRTLPAATKGQAYSYIVQVTNLQGTPKWDLAGGRMPPGMTLNPVTGEISGTCVTAGTWSFNARVKDASTDDTLTLTVKVR